MSRILISEQEPFQFPKANHRVFMQFVRRDLWRVTFLPNRPSFNRNPSVRNAFSVDATRSGTASR